MRSNSPPLILVFAALTLAACADPTPRFVTRNGSWAQDGSEVLLVESRWQSSDPSQPYYNDEGSEWEVVLYRATPDLATKTELLRFPDEAEIMGGGILYKPVFWLKEAGQVVGLEYNIPFARDLATGLRADARMPDAVTQAHFEGFDIPTDEGLVQSYAPSPDGRTLAVFYVLGYAPEGGGPFDIAFRHVVAFFDLEAKLSYLGSHVLDHWAGAMENLQFDQVVADVGLPVVEPPAVSDREPLSFPASFLWAPDSSGIYVINRGDPDMGEVNEAAFVPRVAPYTPVMLAATDPLPGLPLVGPWGPVSPSGEALVIKENPDDPNHEVAVEVMQATGWVPYADAGTTTLEAMTFGR